MPLHDVGYRPWQGDRRGPGSAIGVIAFTGIRLAWTSHWLRRMVLLAWSPAIVFAMSFFAFEQAIDEDRLASLRQAAQAGRNLDGVGMLGTVLADRLGGSLRKATDDPSKQPDGDPAIDAKIDIIKTRHVVWSRLLLAFMRVPQAVLLAVVIGLIAPSLISRDLRAKAWLVYFTRPVGRIEYVLGKVAVLGAIVAAITVLPALSLWLMGVLVSPSIWVAVDTWDLPLKAVAASVALAVPTVLLALAYSSVTAESRIASFAWFATWAACWIAHSTLTTADSVAAAQQAQNGDRPAVVRREGRAGGSWSQNPFGDVKNNRSPADRRSSSRDFSASGGLAGRFRWLSQAAGMDPAIDRWAWLSPYHALGVVQAWIFGIETRPMAVVPSLLSLSLVSIGAVLVLFNRINAPTRV
jgi:ABC-type transport system involved in multi-copper enzyme maturation permease subunit